MKQVRQLICSIVTVITGLYCAAAFAENENTGAAVVSTSSYVLQTLLGLGLVLAIIFAIAWLAKRFGHGTLVGNSRMNVLSVLPLGQRERVVLIEVGDQQFLVGVTSQSVNLLTEFSTPVISKEERAQSEFSKKILEIMRKGPVR